MASMRLENWTVMAPTFVAHCGVDKCPQEAELEKTMTADGLTWNPKESHCTAIDQLVFSRVVLVLEATKFSPV